MQERMAHLRVSPDGQTFHLKFNGMFAHGARTGVSCTPKVSLCDAMICVVASDFFVASRRPMCGHTPLLIILYALDVMLQKSSNGQHRHAAVVGKHTWLELPYPKFLQMTLSDCDEGAVVRLALPTVCSVSLNRK